MKRTYNSNANVINAGLKVNVYVLYVRNILSAGPVSNDPPARLHHGRFIRMTIEITDRTLNALNKDE